MVGSLISVLPINCDINSTDSEVLCVFHLANFQQSGLLILTIEHLLCATAVFHERVDSSTLQNVKATPTDQVPSEKGFILINVMAKSFSSCHD